jgi:hypothetical protein
MSDHEAIRSGKSPERKREDLPQLDEDTLNIVGTAYSGPAFVPQQFSRFSKTDVVYNTFENIFGNNINNKYKNLKDEYNYHSDSKGYEASRNWFLNGGRQLSFTRVLGIGNGKLNSEGICEKSGYNVSDVIYSGSLLSNGEYINKNAVAEGIEGSTSFIVKEYTNKTVDSDFTFVDPFRDYLSEELGIGSSDKKAKFITDIVMCPSGVLPSLHYYGSKKQVQGEFKHDITSEEENISLYNSNLKAQKSLFSFLDTTSSSVYGYPLGNISKFDASYSPILLNGFNNQSNSSINNIVKIKESSDNYIINNKSYNESYTKNYYASKTIDKGHYFYCTFQNNSALSRTHYIDQAESNIGIFTVRKKSIVDSNASSINLPDYNSFNDKYRTALTPWITSQPINRVGIEVNKQNIYLKVERLFRFYSLTDGESGNKYRIKICPKKVFNKEENKHSVFDVFVFEYNVIENSYFLLESYEGLNLNPDDINYIGRRIGTNYSYYNIETKKVYDKGDFFNISNHIRVEVSDEVTNKSINKKSMPSGFESYPHINFKKEVFNIYKSNSVGITEFNTIEKFNNYFSHVYQTPLTYVPNYIIDESILKNTKLSYNNSWGPLFFNIKKEKNRKRKVFKKTSGAFQFFNYFQNKYIFLEDSFENKTFSPHYFYTKFFNKNIVKKDNSNNDISNQVNTVIEESNWLNSFFHLEKISYPVSKIEGSEKISWEDSLYIRSGKELKNNNFHNGLHECYKYVNIDNLLNESIDRNCASNSLNLSFDVFTYGGFDGTNILDKDKKFLNNLAISREKYREDFSTTKLSYEAGIEISTRYENCLNDIFIIPGISSKDLIVKTINISNEETRFVFISDIRETTINSETSEEFLIVSDNVNKSREDSIGMNIVSSKIQYRENEISNFNDYYKKFLGSDYRSRFFIPVLGEVFNSTRQTVVCPTIYTSGLMAKTISEGINSEKFQYSIGNMLIDNENLKYTDLNFKENSKDFKSNSLNILYEDNSNTSTHMIKLHTANTTFPIRDSVYRQVSSVRTINFIKKRLENELVLNSNSILFQLNSKVNDIYKLTENRIKSIMNNLVSEEIISDFYVAVPKIQLEGINNDLLSNLLRIKVYVKLMNASDQSDKTETITLSELNKEIKSLTSLSEDIQLIKI